MGNSLQCKFVPAPESKPEPKLRHEFVGMMFAVTIGEVGLQIAPLVQAGKFIAFLPAYSHLLLATIAIAASWVGWTLSAAPGARKDVTKIFQWEFLVLLLDVALVICYFILVRSVNFEKNEGEPHIASAYTVAWVLLSIFGLYFLWDILTKIIIYTRDVKKVPGQKLRKYYDANWWKNYGLRMLPTMVCLTFAGVGIWLCHKIEKPSVSADIAFIGLVLLFRALKEFVSAVWPSDRRPEEEERTLDQLKWQRQKWSILATLGCILLMCVAALWTWYALPIKRSPRSAAVSSTDNTEMID